MAKANKPVKPVTPTKVLRKKPTTSLKEVVENDSLKLLNEALDKTLKLIELNPKRGMMTDVIKEHTNSSVSDRPSLSKSPLSVNQSIDHLFELNGTLQSQTSALSNTVESITGSPIIVGAPESKIMEDTSVRSRLNRVVEEFEVLSTRLTNILDVLLTGL